MCLLLSFPVIAAVAFFFFFNETAPPDIYTLSLHDALPICSPSPAPTRSRWTISWARPRDRPRSEEHTSELQSLRHLVCRLLLEKKKKIESPISLDLASVYLCTTTSNSVSSCHSDCLQIYTT